VPTAAWAKKVYPHLEPELAVEALWKAILKAVRVDENEPVEAWQAHLDALRRRYRTLNDYNFLKLKFISGLGTDLEVALPKGHMWLGGADEMDDGHFFVANMPTEEIFTLPKRDAVNGIVVASMPLNLNGTLIEDFRIRFENGKVVEFSAAQGETALKSFLETDEGASYLGEVALVAASSPIARTGHLFYNTLFDENAACHLALGKAYPVCLKNYDEYSKDELDQIGFNQSLVHMDFMFGTPDMKVTGITQDGLSVEIMRDGEFVI
jgi:aminopeptidase